MLDEITKVLYYYIIITLNLSNIKTTSKNILDYIILEMRPLPTTER